MHKTGIQTPHDYESSTYTFLYSTHNNMYSKWYKTCPLHMTRISFMKTSCKEKLIGRALVQTWLLDNPFKAGGGHTRQEAGKVSPTKSRISPSIQRIDGLTTHSQL